jgi:carbamoyltransferase
MLILGVNTDHSDSSAALVDETGVVAAICEERINREKHSPKFPALAIQEVLRIAGRRFDDVTDVAIARDPAANLVAKAAFALRYPQHAVKFGRKKLEVHEKLRSLPERVAEGLGISVESIRARFHQVEHHLAHVASAYLCSPFDDCGGLSVDASGDFASAMWADCRGGDIKILRRALWPHSAGVFYTAVTQFCGFSRFGEEYKVMGLSAYGVPRYLPLMRKMVRYTRTGGLKLDLDYFIHHRSEVSHEKFEGGEIVVPTLYSDKLVRELGPARERGAPLTDRERDLAASMQVRYEEVFLEMVDHLVAQTGSRRIALAGGCALNSVANGRMITEGHVDEAYFQPAASDDGTAAGAALQVMWREYHKRPTRPLRAAYLGTDWTDAQIEADLTAAGHPFQRMTRGDLVGTVAEALAGGQIVGWFQGREEWGPRALGNRSILAHPGWPDMKAILNARIKNREPFRPFAPIVPLEHLERYFQGSHPVPFMIMVYRVRPEMRPKLSAITHEDATARVQTIAKDENPLTHELMLAFEKRTGISVLLNTSFNENEPIVHTPRQAVDCFLRTKMDALAIGSYWLTK